MSHHEGAVEHAHPGPATYIKIAVILAVITIIEVATYYIPQMESVLVPILLVLSAGKFALVVMYYMHLKFDKRLLTGVFLWGLFVALSIIVAMIALYNAW